MMKVYHGDGVGVGFREQVPDCGSYGVGHGMMGMVQRFRSCQEFGLSWPFEVVSVLLSPFTPARELDVRAMRSLSRLF